MERALRRVAFAISSFAMLSSVSFLSAQTAEPKESCAPVSLELVLGKNGDTNYKLSGRIYTGYPLDDLRASLSDCEKSRFLYVLVDSHIPIGQIPSAVASKLQVNNVRYFIRYPESEHLIVEIKIVGYRSTVPQ